MMAYLLKKLGWINPAENGRDSISDFDDFQDDATLPKTEREAIDKGIEILRKLEFRAMRAADMNYTHSNDYGRLYDRNSTILALVSGISSIPAAQKVIELYVPSYMQNLPKSPIIQFIVFPAITAICIYYFACPKYLLPQYKEKERVHNNAGAAWQSLQIKIEAFLETTTLESVTPERIRKTIEDFADERKQVCEIVCPEQHMYLTVTNAPERCARRVANLDKSYKTYRKLLKKHNSEHVKASEV